MRTSMIGVIGPNENACSKEMYNFGIELGKLIIDSGYNLVCGGMDGMMKAVCEGAHKSENYSFGKTIGILPQDNKLEANEFVDIVIPTGIGAMRNKIIINTAELLIAVAGGAGTLSEIAFAWEAKKEVICYTEFDGWAKNMAGKRIDLRNNNLLIPASSLTEIQKLIKG